MEGHIAYIKTLAELLLHDETLKQALAGHTEFIEKIEYPTTEDISYNGKTFRELIKSYPYAENLKRQEEVILRSLVDYLESPRIFDKIHEEHMKEQRIEFRKRLEQSDPRLRELFELNRFRLNSVEKVLAIVRNDALDWAFNIQKTPHYNELRETLQQMGALDHYIDLSREESLKVEKLTQEIDREMLITILEGTKQA